MAVFPDRIVLKSSNDAQADVISAISADGADSIVPGELVISRGDGIANIYTLDQNGDVVSASVPRLDGLLDVNLSDPIPDNSVLVYDSAAGFWQAESAPAFDISGNDLRDLADVAVDVDPPQGDILFWDKENQQWDSALFQPHQLNGVTFTDPSQTFPEDGQVLRYNTSPDPNLGDVFGWQVTYPRYDDIFGRPESLSDLNGDLNLGDLNDVDLTSNPPEVGDLIAWTGSAWSTVPAPPVDLSGGTLGELGDVDETLIDSNAVPVYNSSTTQYEVKPLEYNIINNRPTALSDLGNDLSVSDFPNDAGYITSTGGLTLDNLADVELSGIQEGQMLIYRSGDWVNEFGPPANISNSSIGELSDVTYTQPGTEAGVLTVTNLGTFNIDPPALGSGYKQELTSNVTFGLGIRSIRENDGTGSGLFADRTRGITLRSDVNLVRLTGRPDATTARPELRFETGDSGAATPTGEYIGFKMPSTINESVTYILPEADGDAGDILATGGDGTLTWTAPAQSAELGDLSDVDLTSIPPTDGQGIIYNAAGDNWIPGQVSDVDLATSSIGELFDVDLTTPPTDGQVLAYNNSTNKWEAADGGTGGGTGGSVTSWSVTANGTSDYIFAGDGFAGTETDPTLYVMRGQTYEITNSMGAHPFQIQSTAGIGGTAYDDGITNNAVSNGTLIWEVRLDAPAELYYQCTAHASMGGTIQVLENGGGGAVNLEDLDNVGGAAQDGDILIYDGGTQTWAPDSYNLVHGGFFGNGAVDLTYGTGRILSAFVFSGGATSPSNNPYVDDGSQAWDDNFNSGTQNLASTNDIWIYESPANGQRLTYPGPFEIAAFSTDWKWFLASNMGCWNGDQATFQVNFNDDNDVTIAGLAAYDRGSYKNGLRYYDGTAWVNAAASGDFPAVQGYIQFEADQFRWKSSRSGDGINPFTVFADMTQVTKIVFTNIILESNYDGGCSASAYINLVDSIPSEHMP